MGISEKLYNLLENYFSNKFQRVILNKQNSTGVPRGSLLFLVYINDLPNTLKLNIKLYADDTSLLIIVRDKNESGNLLRNVLLAISKWAYNWKMLFNPDPCKSAHEMLFSRKKKFRIHATISLNNIERASYQKHLGVLLDEKLNFKEHISNAILNINKCISVIKNSGAVCHGNP